MSLFATASKEFVYSPILAPVSAAYSFASWTTPRSMACWGGEAQLKLTPKRAQANASECVMLLLLKRENEVRVQNRLARA